MKLLFLGDFLFDYLFIPKDFENICKYVQKNNYKVILNLECSLTNRGEKKIKRGPNLCSSELAIEALKKLNVILVSLANNHSMDYGEKSLLETIKLLEESGIAVVGAGKNYKEATKSYKVKLDNKDFIFQAFGWEVEETVYAQKKSAGCSPLYRKKILNNIKKIKSENPNGKIINLAHMGFEYNLLPQPLDIEFAHKCIEKGSDLFIGTHPHVIQPKEIYEKRNIYYSLGNFYFGSRRELFNKTFENIEVKNMCDYGLGVIYDTEKEIVEKEILFIYLKNEKITIIEEDYKRVKRILNICEIEEWKTKEYLKKCKKYSNNINPILGLNSKRNFIKLKQLTILYFLAKIFSVIRKNKTGEKIWYFFKDKLKEGF